MAGTKAGGKAAASTNKTKYGAGFYQRIGAMGGSTKTDKPKGWAANREFASRMGTIGGKKSRRS